jgi:drug/metabolite transporter (DMT)-like permease
MTLSRLVVLLTAVALATTGQLVLKHGMLDVQQGAHASGRPLLLVAATSPWIIGGLMIFGASAVGWLITLAHVPLSVAYPFNSLGYIAIITASSLLLHEHTNPWMWLGTILVGSGLVLVVVMAPASSDSAVGPPQVHKPAAKVSATDVQNAPEPGSRPLPPRRAT